MVPSRINGMILKLILLIFIRLFSKEASMPIYISIVSQIIPCLVLENEDTSHLATLTSHKVQLAIFSLHLSSAPRPYGFSWAFYRVVWEDNEFDVVADV